MADSSEQLIEALAALEQVTDSFSPDDAFHTLDETALQVFWRDWPHISSWAGGLWRRLNQDLAASATPDEAGAVDTGGGD